MTGIQRRAWGGGGSACAAGRWGSEKVGGHKLIMAIDGSMDVLESVSLSLARSAACVPSESRCRLVCGDGRARGRHRLAAAKVAASPLTFRLSFTVSFCCCCCFCVFRFLVVLVVRLVPLLFEEKKICRSGGCK